MSLPKFATADDSMTQMQTVWAAAIDPLLRQPLSNGILLQSLPLASGANVINHKLGRKLQGWFLTRSRGVAASVYDTQDTNAVPNLTLTLNSSAAVVVDIFVF